jgi:uncharacterized protein (TIGR02466 family)
MNELEQVNLIPSFPTPIAIIKIGRSFTKSETDCFQNIPMRKFEKGMTNHQSRDSYLFDTFAEELKDIKNFCERQLKSYLEEIEGVDTDLAGLRITQSWLGKTKPGENLHLHTHSNSYLSATLYIQCLPNDSIHFEKYPLCGSYNNLVFPTKKITMWNASGFNQNVTEGDMIIFPSWVMHQVNVNETKDKERISLTFDTFPIGEMGNSESTQLKL